MPAYSYKEMFVPMVLDGSKHQTVRARRKNTPKVGQIAYNYWGMRTKNCRKLNDREIMAVQGIVITKDKDVFVYPRAFADLPEMEIAKQQPEHWALPSPYKLDNFHKDQFAWEDGFRPDGSHHGRPNGAFELMLQFWDAEHNLPFAGDVIIYKQVLSQ